MPLRVRLFAVLLALVIPAAASAQSILVYSTFDAGIEGWSNTMLPYPSAVPPTILNTYTPTWTAGHLSMVDPDGSGSSGDAQYWQAPAKFLGNQSAARKLWCDLADVGSGFGLFTQEDVILVGNSQTLSGSFTTAPGSGLAQVSMDLDSTTLHVGGLAGPHPTTAQIASVLGNLTQLFVRAEYQLGPDTQSLDNVALTTAGFTQLDVGPRPAPAALELALASPNPGTGAMRFAFALPRAGAADVGVYDAAGRRVSTLAHGMMDAGRHAVSWDGRDASGSAVRAGLYWVRLVQGGDTVTRRIARLE